MNLKLFFHESIHLILSLTAFFIVLFIYKKLVNKRPVTSNKKRYNYLIILLLITSSLIGGFFIDLDHFFDYFLAFPYTLNANYFFKGYQFLKSDKIIIPLHSFEIVLLLFIIYYLISIGARKTRGLLTFKFLRLSDFRLFRLYGLLALSFSLSLLIHIVFDIIENEMPPLSYSLIYRAKNNFNLKNLVYPSHYRYHLEQKKKIKLN